MGFIKENLWLIVALIVAVVIVIISLISFFSKVKNKEAVIPVNVEELEIIYLSLGLNNIVSVDKEQDRIRLILKDPKLVDAKKLTELSIPAFLKGKEVKLLYRNHSNELYDYIKERVEI